MLTSSVRYPFLLSIAVLSLVLISPLPVSAYQVDGATLTPTSFPTMFTPLPPRLKADLDGDGLQETVDLNRKAALIRRGDQVLWQSPAGWQVDQTLIADLTHDGKPEAVLLVWRPHKDWPIDQYIPHPGRIAAFQDAHGQSCQIILIGWRRTAFGEVWAGSALAEPVHAMAAIPAGTGGDDLVSLTGRYDEPVGNPASSITVWEWNGFGFSSLSNLPGIFIRMQPGKSSGDQWLLLTD
jgi:hypothetical protein